MLANIHIRNNTKLGTKISLNMYTKKTTRPNPESTKYLLGDPSVVVVVYPGPSAETSLDEENGGREPGNDGVYQLFNPKR